MKGKFLFSVFIFPSIVFGFFDPLYSSYQMVKQYSQAANIDNSHNHNHAKEVLFWAQKIIEKHPKKLLKRDILCIGQISLLHDLIDPKYHDFSQEVQEHLERYHAPFEVDIMMKVMKSMSYRKTFHGNKVFFPAWLEDSPFFEIYHIPREADLLASYDVARMVEFRRAKSPFLNSTDGIQECIELFENRMSKLLSNGFFVHSQTVELASSLEKISKLKMELLPTVYEYKNLDILRIVHYLSIFDLIPNMERLPSISK